MAEDIIIKVKLDGAQKEIDNLGTLQKEIKRLADVKKNLTKQEKQLTESIQQNGDATGKQTEALNQIRAKQVENTTALKLNKTAYRENEAQVIRNTKANQGQTGSLVQMRAALAKDQRAYDLLSKAERNNEKIGGRLQKSILRQTASLKGLEKQTGRTQRNVGNYGSAMNGMLPIMGGFGSQLMSIQTALATMKTSLAATSASQKGLATSTKATNKGLKAFRIALISTGIGAIVVALGTMIAAFLSTQRGVDALTKVLRPLQEIMQSLLGVIQDFSTSALDQLFEDPKQAVIDLGTAIKDNFLNRLKGGVLLVKSVAKAYVNTFKLIGLGIKSALADVPLVGRLIDKEALKKDLEETKKETAEAFKDIGGATIQFSLGLDEDHR
jgi:hypothetical protein